MNGHQPAIKKVVDDGNDLIKSQHFAAPDISDKKQEVEDAWDELLRQAENRKKNLEYNLAKQKVC